MKWGAAWCCEGRSDEVGSCLVLRRPCNYLQLAASSAHTRNKEHWKHYPNNISERL